MSSELRGKIQAMQKESLSCSSLLLTSFSVDYIVEMYVAWDQPTTKNSSKHDNNQLDIHSPKSAVYLPTSSLQAKLVALLTVLEELKKSLRICRFHVIALRSISGEEYEAFYKLVGPASCSQPAYSRVLHFCNATHTHSLSLHYIVGVVHTNNMQLDILVALLVVHSTMVSASCKHPGEQCS